MKKLLAALIVLGSSFGIVKCGIDILWSTNSQEYTVQHQLARSYNKRWEFGDLLPGYDIPNYITYNFQGKKVRESKVKPSNVSSSTSITKKKYTLFISPYKKRAIISSLHYDANYYELYLINIVSISGNSTTIDKTKKPIGKFQFRDYDFCS